MTGCESWTFVYECGAFSQYCEIRGAARLSARSKLDRGALGTFRPCTCQQKPAAMEHVSHWGQSGSFLVHRMDRKTYMLAFLRRHVTEADYCNSHFSDTQFPSSYLQVSTLLLPRPPHLATHKLDIMNKAMCSPFYPTYPRCRDPSTCTE